MTSTIKKCVLRPLCAGFSSLFEKKEGDIDLSKVDEIEYIDKNKNIAFMNLRVAGRPEDFKVALGRDKSPRGKLR